MLNLNEIQTFYDELHARIGPPILGGLNPSSFKVMYTWLPKLIAELREARTALESMEAERDRWRMDWETATAKSLQAHQELEQARAEIERLRALVPSPEQVDEGYFQHIEETDHGSPSP